MAENEKKIIFSAQDQVSGKANQIYNSLLNKAKEVTASTKEQNSYIEKQIQLLEKRAEMEKKSSMRQLVGDYTRERGAAGTSQQTNELRRWFESSKKDVEGAYSEKSALYKKLSALHDEAKRGNTISQKIEKEAERNTQNQAKGLGLSGVGGGGAKPPFAPGTGGGTAAGGSQGGGMFPPSNQSAQQASQQSNYARDVFRGLSLREAVQSIGKLASANTGNQVVNAAGHGVGDLLMSSTDPRAQVAGALIKAGTYYNERVDQARMSYGPEALRLRAMTGRNIGMGGNIGLGFSSQEALQTQEGLIRASGGVGGLNQLRAVQTIGRAAGLGQEELIKIVSDSRTFREDADVSRIVGQVIRANPDLLTNKAQMSERLRAVSTIGNTIASQAENVDRGQLINILGSLHRVGGSWADPNLGVQNVQALNQGLSNPQNEFARARGLGILNALKPGSSPIELLAEQERGINSPGFLEATLKDIRKRTGGGAAFQSAIYQAFPQLGAGRSIKLAEFFEKNPGFLSALQGQEVSQGKLDELIGEKPAREAVTLEQKQAAFTEDSRLQGVMHAIGASVTNPIVSAINGMGKDMSESTHILKEIYRQGATNSLYDK